MSRVFKITVRFKLSSSIWCFLRMKATTTTGNSWCHGLEAVLLTATTTHRSVFFVFLLHINHFNVFSIGWAASSCTSLSLNFHTWIDCADSIWLIDIRSGEAYTSHISEGVFGRWLLVALWHSFSLLVWWQTMLLETQTCRWRRHAISWSLRVNNNMLLKLLLETKLILHAYWLLKHVCLLGWWDS